MPESRINAAGPLHSAGFSEAPAED